MTLNTKGTGSGYSLLQKKLVPWWLDPWDTHICQTEKRFLHVLQHIVMSILKLKLICCFNISQYLQLIVGPTTQFVSAWGAFSLNPLC